MLRAPIAIVGPTAVGKSAASLHLAALYGAEIVSVDSMQVYQGMDIGTAKPGPQERSLVPHHLIDIASPYEDFSVALYQSLGRRAIDDIISRGRLPLLVGGSGLYLRALIDEMDFPPPCHRLRDAYYSMPEEEAIESAYRELLRLDPETAERLGAHNLRRLVRALELREVTGVPPSLTRRRFGEIGRHYPDCLVIGLAADRALLHERIDRRVEEMFRKGLIEEARRLREGGELSRTASQALGYRQVFEYLDSKRGLDETIQLVKTATRRYAKRQMTWFRGDPRVRWITLEGEELDDPAKACAAVVRILEETLEVKGGGNACIS